MARRNKRMEHLYGKMARNLEPYYHQLDLRLLDELDDEAFAYITANLKAVNMLDLNETRIGNESMRLLTRLEYVRELRIKGCRDIDDGCIGSLNQVKGLSFIHARNTGITVDGLLGLTAHPDMKTLLFSANEGDRDLQAKMLALRSAMPACEFIIDGRVYLFPES